MAQFPKNIWLIEDDKAFAESLKYIIDNISDLQCTKHFPSAENLLAFIKSPSYQAAPDLILLDIQLPGQNGFDTLRQLNPLMPGIPIVMMTMKDDKQSILEAMQSGAVGYIIKGDPYDKVLDVIHAALEGALLVTGLVKEKLLDHLHHEEKPADFNLTARQKEVLSLMCEGLTKAQIAVQLSISHATVDNHFRRIYQKLSVRSAHAAVATALKKGLVPLSE